MARDIVARDGAARKAKPWYAKLYYQVIIAIAVGILLGHFYPHSAVKLKPLGDAFIALIKMMITPIIFCNVVYGIASMTDMKKVGRLGVKTLAYFEVVSTFALIVGIIVAEVFQPGSGFNIDLATLDPKNVAGFVNRARQEDVVTFLMRIIPDTFVGALTGGNLLQTILISIFTGFAISRMGEFGRKATAAIEMAGKVAFGIIGIISKAAPVGALGAMAFTVGAFGAGSLWNLAQLIFTFYLTALLFILVVLGLIANAAGFSIFRFLAYIKDELLLVFATSSSEVAMPMMMEKLERLGASKSVVGLVFPTGYSFNTDGSSIYLTLCIFFLAQATNTHISFEHMLGILAFAMVTSKGGTGVSGGGFVTLAATLAAAPEIPVQALALLLGIDKFMSECRGLTNIIGNGVATVVVSRWEGELDPVKLRAVMSTQQAADAVPAPAENLGPSQL